MDRQAVYREGEKPGYIMTATGWKPDPKNFHVTYKEVMNAIPKHCFQRSFVRGMRHLIQDFVEIGLWIAVQLFVVDWIGANVSVALAVVVSLLVAFMQGVMMTSVWVIAHECGHGAFSSNEIANDIVGFVCHSILFVPYFGWQRSHAKHHRFTGNLLNEEVWIPENVVREEDKVYSIEYMKDKHFDEPRSWQATLWGLFVDSSIGYVPKLFTLILGATSKLTGDSNRDTSSGESAPSLEAASTAESRKVVVEPLPAWKSNADGVGVFIWVLILATLLYNFGAMTMVRAYFMPLVVTLFFLTTITFLHHTDESLPFYDDYEWTWFKAACLNTMDRSMGRFMDIKLHFIHSTHVAHHVFSRIPFYHCEEVTEVLKSKLGDYYNESPSKSFYGYCHAIWHNYMHCVAMVKRKDREGLWWFTGPTKSSMELR